MPTKKNGWDFFSKPPPKSSSIRIFSIFFLEYWPWNPDAAHLDAWGAIFWHKVITKDSAYVCRTNDTHLCPLVLPYSLCSELLWPIFRKARSQCFARWSKEKMMNIRAEVLFCHCKCAFSHAALKRLSGMTDTVDAGSLYCMHLLKKWTVACKVNEEGGKEEWEVWYSRFCSSCAQQPSLFHLVPWFPSVPTRQCHTADSVATGLKLHLQPCCSVQNSQLQSSSKCSKEREVGVMWLYHVVREGYLITAFLSY